MRLRVTVFGVSTRWITFWSSKRTSNLMLILTSAEILNMFLLLSWKKCLRISVSFFLNLVHFVLLRMILTIFFFFSLHLHSLVQADLWFVPFQMVGKPRRHRQVPLWRNWSYDLTVERSFCFLFHLQVHSCLTIVQSSDLIRTGQTWSHSLTRKRT